MSSQKQAKAACPEKDKNESNALQGGYQIATNIGHQIRNHFDRLLIKVMQFLYQPIDPSSLAIARVLYGLLMVVDVTEERGMGRIKLTWGDPESCIFPFFDILRPLSADWMHVVYISMIIAAICICIGYRFRFACSWLAVCYWYVFLLDKTKWNNHSYLFGLMSILFLHTQANRWWSVDGMHNKDIRNVHIPRWNLAIFQFQLFLVYFYAGIKKLDSDWITGNSMTSLGQHWVFFPLRMFLTVEEISLYIVHYGGFMFDLLEGFLLFFDITRPLGLLLGCYFHSANSFMFSIGIFPYAMLATLPMFCEPDWPKKLILKLSPRWQKYFILTPPLPYSAADCYYEGHIINKSSPTDKKGSANSDNNSINTNIATDNKNSIDHDQTTSSPSSSKRGIRKFSKKNKATVLALSVYILIQLLLPFSHSVTQGYTGWDDHGLYGYSWDMMVKTWSIQHVKITVVDLSTGHHYNLKSNAFRREKPRQNTRWNSHPDMMKQYATCIARRMKKLGAKQPAVYFDVWKSMNRRFQQRIVDPRVDIVTAPWSTFRKTPWIMPLLHDLTSWRSKMVDIDTELLNDTLGYSTNYVADFPGLTLENFVQPDYQANLTVLAGQVRVSVGKRSHLLNANQTAVLPSNTTHEVKVTSKNPAIYFYIFKNHTLENMLQEEMKNISAMEEEYALTPIRFIRIVITGIITGIRDSVVKKALNWYYLGNNTIHAFKNIVTRCNCFETTKLPSPSSSLSPSSS